LGFPTIAVISKEVAPTEDCKESRKRVKIPKKYFIKNF
jgi:hypothetical protein